MIIIFLQLASAFCWFGFALGLMEPAHWIVPVAFSLCGSDVLLAAMKRLAGVTS